MAAESNAEGTSSGERQVLDSGIVQGDWLDRAVGTTGVDDMFAGMIGNALCAQKLPDSDHLRILKQARVDLRDDDRFR